MIKKQTLKSSHWYPSYDAGLDKIKLVTLFS